jgi:hypothetical protein
MLIRPDKRLTYLVVEVKAFLYLGIDESLNLLTCCWEINQKTTFHTDKDRLAMK